MQEACGHPLQPVVFPLEDLLSAHYLLSAWKTCKPTIPFLHLLLKKASLLQVVPRSQEAASQDSLRSSKYLAVLLFLQLCQRNAIHLPPLSVTELSSRSLLRIKTILAIQSSLKTSGWEKHIPVDGVGTFSRGSTAQQWSSQLGLCNHSGLNENVLYRNVQCFFLSLDDKCFYSFLIFLIVVLTRM